MTLPRPRCEHPAAVPVGHWQYTAGPRAGQSSTVYHCPACKKFVGPPAASKEARR